MFHTEDSAEIPLSNDFAPDGIRAWAWVDLTAGKPYYWLSYQMRGSDVRRQSIFLDVSLLLKCVSDWADELSSMSVSLISPPGMNSTDRMQMDLIEEIWSTPDQDSFLMRTISGRRYKGNYLWERPDACDMIEKVWPVGEA